MPQPRTKKRKNPKPPKNLKLEAARTALPSPSGVPDMCMSRRELAEVANAYVWKHTNGQQRTTLSERDIGRYERYEAHWPDEWRRLGLRGVLGASSDAELGFYPTRKTNTNISPAAITSAQPEPDDPSAADVAPVQRYAWVDGLHPQAIPDGLAPVAAIGQAFPGESFGQPSRPAAEMIAYIAAQESWRHAAGSGGAVEEASIEHASTQVRRLAGRYHQLPPIRALADAREVRNLAYMLLERTRKPGQMADLYLTAGQACGLLAMASFDLAQWDAAADQIGAARAYADLAGHPSLHSWAAGTQALIAYWTGQPRQALSVLESVEATAADGAPAARLHAIRARAWSYLGDAEEVTGALLTADRAMDSAHGIDDFHDGIGGELGWGRSLHHACVGTALLAIGRAAAAAQRIRDALEVAPDDPYSGLVPPRARIDLAAAELAAGRFDAAVDALGKVWETPARYRRHGVTARLEQFGRTLQAPDWRDHGPAAELRDRIEVFVGEAVAARALPAA